MTEELSRLIENISACGNSSKKVIDDYVSKMMSLRDASLKADAEFQQKQENYNAEIARLHELRDQLRTEQIELERKLKTIQHQIAAERAEIGKAKQQFRESLNEITTRPAA